MPLLSELIAKTNLDLQLLGDASVAITSITSDSRKVKPGSLFVAMPGVNADGAKFIPDALRNGAAAVLCASGVAGAPLPVGEVGFSSDAKQRLENPGEGASPHTAPTIPTLYVRDMREAVSKIAAAFYPNQPEFSVAITGTDGKTSTADFVRQLAQLSGMDAASIGTLGLRSEHAARNAAFPALNTSPEPILLHETLSDLASAGVRVVAIETSSHGLDQKRADGVRFAAAAFTNLTRDHLDYHGTLEAYFVAKARLFSVLMGEGKLAVLNRDDAHFADLKKICDARHIRILSFGTHADADYHILSVTPHAHGLDATLVLRGTQYHIQLPLYGAFQLSNMLAAVGLFSAAGLDESALIALLPRLTGVPGRLEKIATHNGAPIFIDYAHTPAALENILKTLRPHTAKKLHVVFGCGGDRDAGKRPEMGAAAAKFADRVIVTDDNPRSEDPAKIRAAILAQCPGAQEIPDRDAAIRAAIQNLEAGDVLVVAGKGHETTQTIGKQVLPFNDADHIRKAVAA